MTLKNELRVGCPSDFDYNILKAMQATIFRHTEKKECLQAVASLQSQ